MPHPGKAEPAPFWLADLVRGMASLVYVVMQEILDAVINRGSDLRAPGVRRYFGEGLERLNYPH